MIESREQQSFLLFIFVLTNQVYRYKLEEKNRFINIDPAFGKGNLHMDYRINESEYRLMDILWDMEPVNSMELAGLCRERLGWKKSTTYTVLRKLGEKKVLRNENAVVRALVSRDEVQRQESREFLKKKFHGSLPAFIAAFLQEEKLTKKEAEELQKLIEQASEEGDK